MKFTKFLAAAFCICAFTPAFADNQTPTLSPILSSNNLPFQVVIEQSNVQLPVGLHSGVIGVEGGLWVFIAGRMNGLHGFGPDPFPPDEQNTNIYVFDPRNGKFKVRALNDPSSGLNQQQIDSLSVTAPEYYQDHHRIYMAGGYGVDTTTGAFSTKPILTAIDLPRVIYWVIHGNKNGLRNSIRQISNSYFQVTGGRMYRVNGLTQLVFGQDFTGVYTTNSDGTYTEQVRRFRIIDDGNRIVVRLNYPSPTNPDPSYRRRDLNVQPVILNNNNRPSYGLVAYSGVFTPGNNPGIWTVPVIIDAKGNPSMADPNLSTTFKQGMNNYDSATAGLYSIKHKNMYNIFFGGISFGFFSNGTFQTDSEIPFINQVTTIQIDKNGNFTQYLMNYQYPTIVSTQSNPGNTLLFGANAYFVTNKKVPHFDNHILSLDNIKKSTVIGYIVGGIQSTLANTNVDSDSAASPYIFKVTLVPTS